MFSQPLTSAIAEAEELVADAPHIETEADLLEGLQYLAGCVAACNTWCSTTTVITRCLLSGTGPFTKMGLDNPDTLYFGCRVQPTTTTSVTGGRGTTTDLSFQLLGGEYTDDNVPASQAAFDDRELEIAADGSFQWQVRPTSPGQLVIREVYGDWSARAARCPFPDSDTAGTAPPPLTRAAIEKRYATAGKQLVNRIKTWLQFPQWFYLDIPVNTMVAPRLTPGGLATQYSSVGHFDLRPDQALIITLPVTDAPYLGFQLGSLWYISLDYINHQTSLNNTQAQADPDGKVRIVVADQNPGVTNWVETLGHRRGFLQFRWQRVSRQLTEADGPSVELVDFDASRPSCRTSTTIRFPTTTGVRESRCANNKLRPGCWGDDVRIAREQGRRDQRRRPGARYHAGAPVCAGRRRPGAGGANGGAAWKDVAKQVNDAGRKALAVRADITDDDEVPPSSRPTIATLRQGRRVDQQRVPGAVDEAVGRHQFSAHPRRDRAQRARRLAAHPGLHAGAGAVARIDRQRQLDGVAALPGQIRRLQDGQVDAAVDVAVVGHRARARRASASIPLPPAISGATRLQAYFEHQAGKYGTTVDQIYAATAANSDLKRLPTEDEVASAILFLASDLSSGITGQTLDVNCGEYHT